MSSATPTRSRMRRAPAKAMKNTWKFASRVASPGADQDDAVMPERQVEREAGPREGQAARGFGRREERLSSSRDPEIQHHPADHHAPKRARGGRCFHQLHEDARKADHRGADQKACFGWAEGPHRRAGGD